MAEKTPRNQLADDGPDAPDSTTPTKHNLHARPIVSPLRENATQLAKKRRASGDPAVERCVLTFKPNPIQEPATVQEFVRVLLSIVS